jgi:hypothetical protein
MKNKNFFRILLLNFLELFLAKNLTSFFLYAQHWLNEIFEFTTLIFILE